MKCAVYDQNIVDGKDQALFCEGNCERWFHRYCSGVTVNHFETLSSTSQPFHCIGCFQQLCNAEMMLLRESICSLKEEVTEVQNALDEMKRTPSSSQVDTSTHDNHPNPEENWKAVHWGSRGRGGRGER